MQELLDLSGWRLARPDETISGKHLIIWQSDQGVQSASVIDPNPDHFTPFTPDSAKKWDADFVKRHDFYTPVLPDTRPGTVLHFISDTGREGFAICQFDKRWGVVYLGGLTPATLSTSQLLREVAAQEYTLVAPGGER